MQAYRTFFKNPSLLVEMIVLDLSMWLAKTNFEPNLFSFFGNGDRLGPALIAFLLDRTRLYLPPCGIIDCSSDCEHDQNKT